MTVWRVRISCWIPKSTNTHPEYVMPIALPLQQWLHERAAMLRYMSVHCLSSSSSQKYKYLFSAFVALSLGVKRSQREIDHLHLVPSSRISGAIPPLRRVHAVHRDNFT